MNTKEAAIEFIKSFKKVVTSIDIENGEGKAIKEYNDKIDKVIELLQRGEKYEQIINRANKDYYGAFVTFGKGTMMELTEFLAGIEQEVMMEGGK